MKSFDAELKKYAEKINLKVSERHELRERILSYMEYHPLPKQMHTVAELQESIPSESFITVHLNTFRARIFIGGVAVLLLVIAPFAAERSVPGDALYLVKTGFNEKIQGQLASSPYEKIEFETKLMERRITEARELASEGKLTEEVKTQIAETVKVHAKTVQDGLAQLRTQDADGAAIAEIAFNSSLEVQSVVLGVNENTENASLIKSILTVVNDARDEVTSNQDETAPSFDGLSAQVEIETTRAYELFETIKLSATPEEISNIERRLSDINRLIAESKKKHDIDPEIAVNNLISTLGLLQKLIVFMTDIDVRETVTLESIVPVVLSDEERIALVEGEIATITSLKEEVLARIADNDNLDNAEKIEEGIVLVEGNLLSASDALTSGDIASAESAARDARAIAIDLDNLTQEHIPEDVPIIEPEETTSSTTPISETATSSTPSASE